MKRILYVLHSGMNGGTFLTNKDLMKHVEKKFDVFLLTAENDFLRLFNYDNGDFELIKEYPRMNKWSAKNFHDSWLSYIYFNVLINFNIDLVHIRHFINHSFDLPYISKKLNIPVVVSLHDFYLLCPFYTLLDENHKYCGAICENNTHNCYNSLESLSDINSKELIIQWRFEVSKLFEKVDFIVSTSNFVKDLFLSIYPEINANRFKIIEHGRDFPDLNEIYYDVPNKDEVIKILCPANYLNIMKGANFIKQLKNVDSENKLEFHFLGNCRDGVERYGIDHGTFERDEFYKKVMEIKPSFIGIFSIWPETFCHTLTEAWSCGIPVLGSNIGVVQDRISKSRGGWIINIDNPQESFDKIINISSDIEEYGSVVNNILSFNLKTTQEMSEEYLNIYNALLFDYDDFNSKNFYIDSKNFDLNKNLIIHSNLFDEEFYLEHYHDVFEHNLNPLEHWVKWGYKEYFRNPNRNFSNSYYSNKYLLNCNQEWNPLTHYIVCGRDKSYKRNIFDFLIFNWDNIQIENILNALSKKISIIIPVINYCDELIICLNLIKENTLNHFDLFILDFNNSIGNLNDIGMDIKIIKNNNNKDLFNLINDVLQNIKNDCVLLNPYSEVSRNWLSNLIIKAYSDKSIGFVTPLSNAFLNIIPFDNTLNDNFSFSIDGLAFLFNRYVDFSHLKIDYNCGFCLFIKNIVLSDIKFKKELISYDSLNNSLNVSLDKSDFNHVLDDSNYIHINKNFFKDNPDFINNCESSRNLINKESFDYLFDILKESNYHVLSNRILFICDSYDDLILEKIMELYDCFFLIIDDFKINLFKNSSLIKSWIKPNNDVEFRDIYFNILFSLKINIVQINNFLNNSFKLVDVCELLNIPIIVNCCNYYFISNYGADKDFENNVQRLFDYSNIIFTNPDFKDCYLSSFIEINEYKLIYDCYVYDENLIFKNKLHYDPIKLVIFGNSNMINKFKDFDFDFTFDFYFFENHNFKEMDINRLNEISPNAIVILDDFDYVLSIVDYSYSNKIPLLLNDDPILKYFVKNINDVGLVNSKSDFMLFKSILKYFNSDDYKILLKNLFKLDPVLDNKLKFIIQDYVNEYVTFENYLKINPHNSSNSAPKKELTDFVDFQGFLANSYVSPIIYAPFSENEKRSFAFMDNISKFLLRNLRKNDFTPFVSIIMPTYNHVDTLLFAIDSVLNQTYEYFELIIVVDGSEDGTKELIKSIDDSRVIILYNDINIGAAKSRNRALNISKGDIVMYLDSDNNWDSKYVETMVAAFYELPDADALYSGQLIYDSSNVLSSIRFGAFNKSLLKNKNYIDLNCFVHKKKIIYKIGGFDENLDRLIDWDFILRISNSCKIYSVPVLLSRYYRDVENGITSKSSGNISIRISNKNYIQCIQQRNSIINESSIKLTNKVTIIIPSYESLDDLRQCVQSIISYNYRNLVKIIIVDNNSTPPVRKYLNFIKKSENIDVIQNNVNYGFTFAINQGIALADPDSDILILNNDAIMTKDSLGIMQNAANTLKDSGIIVPQQVLPGGTPTINVHVPYAVPEFECDVNPSKHHKNIINMPLFHNGDILELNFAPFFCVYIKREVLDKSGNLDAELGRHYRSDRIFSEYVRNILKLKIYHISAAIVYHKLQKSTEKLKDDKNNYEYIFLKNQWDDDLAKKLGYKKALWDI